MSNVLRETLQIAATIALVAGCTRSEWPAEFAHRDGGPECVPLLATNEQHRSEDEAVLTTEVAVDATARSPECGDGLQLDGEYCAGWLAINPAQRCLDGSPTLVATTSIAPWEDHPLLGIHCADELPQVYLADDDRWERMDVGTLPLERTDDTMLNVESPASVLASATLSNGTRVAVSGSLHAHPPFTTWIADAEGDEWRRSVDAPWMNPFGAGPIASDSLLFAGDDSFLFVYHPRP